MSIKSPHAEFHAMAGAKLAEYFGCLLPERYVEPKAECRYTREAAGIFDTSFHAVFSLTGPDRVRFLNAISTGNIQGLGPQQGVRGLLLNPQGHILAELLTFARPEDSLVLTHAAIHERTATHLEKYIIMDDVQLVNLTDKYSSLALEGPAARPIIHEIFGASPDVVPELTCCELRIGDGTCFVIRTSFFGEAGVEFLVPHEQFASVWQAYHARIHEKGGGPLGYAAINAMRLEAGIPWFGYDFDEKVIPHEAGLEHSHISYTKGCYTGQEIVERVRSRGQVHRKLTRLQFLGLQVPSPGTRLFVDDTEVGVVTSAAFAPLLGRVLGFAYVRTEHREAGTMLTWSGGEVEVL